MPAEEYLVPSRRYDAAQGLGRNSHHGDDADGQRRDGKQAELEDFSDDDAEHAALDHVECGDRHEDQGILIGGEVSGKEIGGELANAFETVGQKPDHTDQRKDDDDEVRQLRAAAFAESGGDPLGAGGDTGAPQPRREVDHQKNLIEDGQQPGNPDALETVDEEQIDQPHGAGDIEHPGCVGYTEHIPRQDIAAQKIGLRVPGSPVRNPVADENGRHQKNDDDDNVQKM